MVEHNVAFELFYDGAWQPAPVLTRDGLSYKRGSKDPTGRDTDPAEAALTLNNKGGEYAPKSALSALRGKIGQNTKSRLSIDGSVRMVGEVASWKPQRPIKGPGWTPIELAGVLRRISSGKDPIRSALYRAMVAAGPVAYWPLEGDVGSGLPDTNALTLGPLATPTFANDSGLPGSAPLPQLVADTTAWTTIFNGNAKGQSATAWTVSLWFKATMETSPVGRTIRLLRWGQNPINSDALWNIGLFHSEPTARYSMSVDNSGYVLANSGPDPFDGNWHHVAATVAQEGPDLRIKFYVDGEVLANSLTTSPDYTLRPAREIEVLHNPGFTLEATTVWMGHLGFFDRVLSKHEVVSLYTAGHGYVGETAAGRFARFCDEEALTATVIGGDLTGTDTFSRTTSNGWGTDSGTVFGGYSHAWTSGSLASFSVSGGTARNSVPTAATYQLSFLADAPLIRPDVYAEFLVIDPTGGNLEAGVLFAGQDLNTYYMARVEVTPSHTVALSIRKRVAAIETLLDIVDVPIVHSSATPIKLRFSRGGGMLRAKAWTGSVEPGYQAASLDTQISAPGWPGVRVGRGAGNTNATDQVQTDNLTIVDDESMPMGAQRRVTLLEQFDEMARTDDASIYETRDVLGLTMRTGVSKMNQAPALTISYRGQIVPTLEPVFGDAGIRNDVAARNPSGATRQVVQETGPHNVQLPEDDPQGVTRYKTSVDVNTADDDDLRDVAGWRVNLGTFDGTWYAEVTADLDAAPGLIAAVNALDIGNVLAISELPVDEALDTYEGVIIGIAEDCPAKRRLVTFYLVPNEPYRVGLTALTSGDTDPFLGHLDTDDTSTLAAVAVGAASFQGVINVGPLWTTIGDDFPFDVIVGGQRVTVASIASQSLDTFDRSVSNGWGGGWTTSGTAANFSVNGFEASIALNAVNSIRTALLSVGLASGEVLLGKLVIGGGVFAAGAPISVGVLGRYVDANNYLLGELLYSTSDTVTARIVQVVAGVSTVLASALLPGLLGSGTAFAARLSFTGTAVQFKVWNRAGVEPGAWTVTATTVLSGQGSVGVWQFLNVGNVNTLPVTFAYDDFQVTNPQTFNVSPTGRQVRYPIAAGESAIVQQPIILAP